MYILVRITALLFYCATSILLDVHVHAGARSLKSVKYSKNLLAVRNSLRAKWKYLHIFLIFTDKDTTVKSK